MGLAGTAGVAGTAAIAEAAGAVASEGGGRFVFLTYADARTPASGPGRETVHDEANYSVDTLDRLIVRLVTDELGKLARPGN